MDLHVPKGCASRLLRMALLLLLAALGVRLWLHLGLEKGVCCGSIGPITWEENVPAPWPDVLPELQTGDVLVTLSVHSLGWRHGHCALVVDGPERMIVEATALGTPSALRPAWTWNRYPTVWLLRAKGLSAAERLTLAEGGLELLGVPYSLISRKVEAPYSAQCATLIWHAYRKLDCDVDSDGGWLVTPRDLLGCELFQVTRLR